MGSKKNRKKTLKIKPMLRLRIRCEEAHKDPWLRRLYVLWSHPPKAIQTNSNEDDVPTADESSVSKGDKDKQIKGPQFFLGQTSVEGKIRSKRVRSSGGYLSPLSDDVDPELNKSVPLFPDFEYWFYFVRHPGADLPRIIQEELNTDFEAAKEKWGEPQKLKPQICEVGKRKTQELVLKIPEDPKCFIPKGSSFYGDWVLFRDMPGTGENEHKNHIQCPALYKQVRRLQYHLGRMRYLIGNHNHPYMPVPWLRHPNAILKNEGVFDIITWNSVIAWQRDAAAGKAMKLDSKNLPNPSLSNGNFDPLLELSNNSNYGQAKIQEVEESEKYVTSESADGNEAKVSETDKYLSVIDETSGDGIKKWLESDLRKPGRILVGYSDCDNWRMWVVEDVTPVLKAIDACMKKLGAKGLGINGAYRDLRRGVRNPSSGSISMSIHKTGYAFDLAMKQYTEPRKGANALKLYYAQDHTKSDYPKEQMHWAVWAKAEQNKALNTTSPEALKNGLQNIVLSDEFKSVGERFKNVDKIAPLIEYANSVKNWKYIDTHKYGGKETKFSESNHCFLNFSKLVSPPYSPFALKPIRAHKSGWQALPRTTIKIEDYKTLKSAIWRLGKNIGKGAKVEITGTKYSYDELKELYKLYNNWFKRLKSYNLSPSVYVTPKSKQGQRLMRILRRRVFKGQKLLVEATPEEAKICKAQTYPPSETGLIEIEELTLSKTTAFPNYNFFITLLTHPVLKAGDEMTFDVVPGHPAHMEWWHFQWLPGYSGKKWASLVKGLGWTDEGLGWCKKERGTGVVYDPPGPYGQTGLGYPASKKNRKAM